MATFVESSNIEVIQVKILTLLTQVQNYLEPPEELNNSLTFNNKILRAI